MQLKYWSLNKNLLNPLKNRINNHDPGLKLRIYDNFRIDILLSSRCLSCDEDAARVNYGESE